MPVVFVVDGMDLRDTVAQMLLVGVASFAFAFVQAVSTCGIEALS